MDKRLVLICSFICFMANNVFATYSSSNADPGETPDVKELSRVLLVDDHPRQTAWISRLLRGNGFQTIPITTSYKDAYRYYQKNRHNIDIITIDLSFNNNKAINLIKKVRRIDKKISIIVICDESKRNLLAKALSAGAKHYVYKPITDKVLLTKIYMGLFE